MNAWRIRPLPQAYAWEVILLHETSHVSSKTALNCICHYWHGFLAWWTGADRNKTMLTDLTLQKLPWIAQAHSKSKMSFKRSVQNKSNRSQVTPKQKQLYTELSSYLQVISPQWKPREQNLLSVTMLKSSWSCYWLEDIVSFLRGEGD